MLRILSSIYSPSNYGVEEDHYFAPGQIAQLYDGKCGVSDGTDPVGIIDDIKNEKDDSTKGSGRITVWTGAITAVTDQYDNSSYFEPEAALYVNEHGKLTTDDNNGERLVFAFVEKAPSAPDMLLTFYTLNE